MIDRFFISGCQRSGTTMLRLILESHPFIQCFDEEAGYNILIHDSRGEISEFDVKEGASLNGFKVPRFAEQLTWAEFSDPDYGVFPSFYNDQKVIHVFRDVFDVIGSMMRLKTVGGVSWLDKYGLSILRAQISNPNLADKFKKKYAELETQGLPLHLVGALYWEIKNQGFFDLLKQNKPVYPVRYETLVNSPKTELQKLSKFLGVNFSDTLLHHHEHFHGEVDQRGIAIGETDSRRPIDTKSVGTYTDLMSDEQIEDVMHNVEDCINNINRVIDNDFRSV